MLNDKDYGTAIDDPNIPPPVVVPKGYSIKEYILFKIDRSIALLGMLALGMVSALVDFPDKSPAPGIINNVIIGLGVYVGVRGKK